MTQLNIKPKRALIMCESEGCIVDFYSKLTILISSFMITLKLSCIQPCQFSTLNMSTNSNFIKTEKKDYFMINCAE